MNSTDQIVDAAVDTAVNTVVDTMGMTDAVEALPDQLEAALRMVPRGLCGSEPIARPSQIANVAQVANVAQLANVLVLGMGGSGIAGDITAALAAPLMGVPVTVVKGYECPAFVGPSTLAIAVSFSGNTEETLEAVTAAHEAGASIVAVTSGGRLAELAGQWDALLYEVDASLPMPRAAVGALCVAPLLALEHVGLLEGVADWVRSAVNQLRARQRQTMTVAYSSVDYEADTLDNILNAVSRGETVPIFYGSALGAVAAARAKAQINENCKIPAYASTMPELCHNELAGWELTADHGSPLAVITLRHDFEHAQLSRRYEFTRSVLDNSRVAVPNTELHAKGDSPMAQLVDLIYQVDLLSLRVAALAQRDPGPIPRLTELKDFLARV